jgi:hypothetical protein
MKCKYGALALLLSLLQSNGGVAAQAAIRLSAFPPTVRVNQEGPIAGADCVQIAGARGEYESFQVVVTAVGAHLEQVDAAIGPLRSKENHALTSENAAIYREAYVPVRHSAPRATCPPGLTPDPLIPFVNPYTGEPIHEPRWNGDERVGPRFGASGFDLWQDRHQPLWVDVRIPKDTPAGLYEGVMTVTAKNAPPAEIRVQATVWDFALPDGPTHENHFGGFGYLAGYHHLDSNSDAYSRLEERYVEMLAAHRINPPIPGRFLPKAAPDGAVQFGEETDRRLTEFVERYHVTNIGAPAAPFGDALGADRAKAIQFYRSWYAYLERKGWAARAYLYMLDEPNDANAYQRVRQLGALVHEAEPRLRRLVVEQPYTQDPAWGVLDGAIDIWCPLFAFIHEPSIQRVRAQGNVVWSYTALVQNAPPYHPEYQTVKEDDPPFWQIDFPVTSYRIAPWLNRRYGITGLLYWSTVYWGAPDRDPWDDPGFRIRWNGDGALFYPGDDAGIEGPIASIRLKNLRDGMEDYEYFVILEKRAGREIVDEIVRAAVPTWGAWVQDPNRLLELRRRLADEILRQAN